MASTARKAHAGVEAGRMRMHTRKAASSRCEQAGCVYVGGECEQCAPWLGW